MSRQSSTFGNDLKPIRILERFVRGFSFWNVNYEIMLDCHYFNALSLAHNREENDIYTKSRGMYIHLYGHGPRVAEWPLGAALARAVLLVESSHVS